VDEEFLGKCEECEAEIFSKSEDSLCFKESEMCAACVKEESKLWKQHDQDIIASWGWL
jgi:hypothetical protein